MKQIFFWGFVLALAALNWAALHDILTGESNVWVEWSFVIGSALLVVVYALRKIRAPR